MAFPGGQEGVKSFQLSLVFENFIDDLLNAEETQGRDQENVGKVDSELPDGFMSAERLDIPHVMARVWICRRMITTLAWLGAEIAEQRGGVKYGSGGHNQTQHDQAVNTIISEI